MPANKQRAASRKAIITLFYQCACGCSFVRGRHKARPLQLMRVLVLLGCSLLADARTYVPTDWCEGWCEAGTRRGHYNGCGFGAEVGADARTYVPTVRMWGWCEAGTRRGHYNGWGLLLTAIKGRTLQGMLAVCSALYGPWKASLEKEGGETKCIGCQSSHPYPKFYVVCFYLLSTFTTLPSALRTMFSPGCRLCERRPQAS